MPAELGARLELEVLLDTMEQLDRRRREAAGRSRRVSPLAIE